VVTRIAGEREERRLWAGEGTLDHPVCQTTVQIKSQNGLHMRPAMQFVDLANRYNCDITIGTEKERGDAKSIMHVIGLAATAGTRLDIRATGPDAEEAVEVLRAFMERQTFDEVPPKDGD
jgi:phosphotransferase system HPr (HPr) family protein